ncbi:MAG: DUF2147 domain-containing protein [Cyclobacteriaceae bacterium]|jgi:uncharacterized protein (DUF2147 family)|nr:DUF2147 domain-containing protein [Flammeovirgaceae bacterium]
MKHLLIILFFFALTSLSAQSNRIIGVWLTADKSAKIEIVQREKNFTGTMIWLEMDRDEQGKPLTDTQNPDPSKRSRLLCGLEIIPNLVYKDGKWKGTIYDPESGKTYSSEIVLVNENTLEVTGYIGLPMFGRTEKWTRVKPQE